MTKTKIIENVTEFDLPGEIEELKRQGCKIIGYEWHMKRGELKITYVDNN